MEANAKHLSVVPAHDPTPLDVGMEEIAKQFDYMGLGDVVRTVWDENRDEMITLAARCLIATWSGADHELAYYGGQP